MNEQAPKPARADLVLPVSEDGFRAAQSLLDWYRNLWVNWPCESFLEDDAIFLTYASLLFDTGLPKLAAIDTVAELAISESRTIQRVRILAQRFDNEFGKTRIYLSRRTQFAFECWKANWTHEMQNWKRLPLQERTDAIVEALSRSFSRLRRSLPLEDVNLRSLSQLFATIAMRRGLSPFLISIYSGGTRPTDQDPNDFYSLTDRSLEFSASLVARVGGSKVSRERRLRSESLVDDTSDLSDQENLEWSVRAKDLLRRMCVEFRDLVPRRVTDSVKRDAEDTIDRFRREAEEFSGRDSALIAAIEYSRDIFLKKKHITSRTLRTYLDRCVINGLLNNTGADRLSEWDVDDFSGNFETRTARLHLTRNSYRNVAQAYRAFFNFLSRYLAMPSLRRVDLAGLGRTAAGQWQLIAPGAVDTVLGRLVDKGDWISRQVAVAVALGFYGGLRISEVRKLKARSILWSKKLAKLDIEILSGKTASARRRLPFDALAPVWVQEMLMDYLEERTSSQQTGNLRDVALLGPRRKPGRYTQSSFSQSVVSRLKEAFGDDVTFHTLRHCFCSNLLVRWYGLRHTDVLSNLRVGGHEIFQPAWQEKLRRYFECFPEDDGEIRPYDLISLIKLTGHASPETLFRYYIHLSYILQEHAVRMADERFPPACPSNRTLTLLLPNMKSSASRAALRKIWEGVSKGYRLGRDRPGPF